MKMMHLNFKVNLKSDFEEMIPSSMPAEEVPAYLAKGKSEAFHRPLRYNEILVTADTVVICDGKVLGKPKHRSVACDMLRMLSGKTHKVVSAVCLRDDEHTVVRSDTAYVTFKELSEYDIRYYVNKYRPVDKAGGYGIQEWIGLTGITRIEGSFYTVMGLPTHIFHQMLWEFYYYE